MYEVYIGWKRKTLTTDIDSVLDKKKSHYFLFKTIRTNKSSTMSLVCILSAELWLFHLLYLVIHFFCGDLRHQYGDRLFFIVPCQIKDK